MKDQSKEDILNETLYKEHKAKQERNEKMVKDGPYTFDYKGEAFAVV